MSGLHVALDARWVQGERASNGVGRSLVQLIPLIAAHPAIGGVTLLTDPAHPATGLGLREVPLRSPAPGFSAAWLQLSAPRWLRKHSEAIFHCDWYGLPYVQPVPMSATLHDILFEHRPEWYSRSRLTVFRAQARHAARTAGRLIAPSEHVKRDIVATYRVEPERVVVAPHGVDPLFRPDAAERQRTPWSDRRYVVAIGGAPRRRTELALASWRESACGADLIVVGEQDRPPVDGVVWAGRLSDDDWAATLAGAQALLYTTEDEGFGMPALEAAASGTPVVCARVGSLPEVLDDAAAWVDDATPSGFAEQLCALLSDPARSNVLRERGLRRAASVGSWQHSCDAHVEAFVRTAAGPTRPRLRP